MGSMALHLDHHAAPEAVVQAPRRDLVWVWLNEHRSDGPAKYVVQTSFKPTRSVADVPDDPADLSISQFDVAVGLKPRLKRAKQRLEPALAIHVTAKDGDLLRVEVQGHGHTPT